MSAADLCVTTPSSSCAAQNLGQDGTSTHQQNPSSTLTVIQFPEQLLKAPPATKTLSNFDKIEKIGEGTFGQVYKGEYTNPETGEKKLVALKKLNMINEKDGFPITALREVKYLKQLNHENIVKLEDILYSKPGRKNKLRGSFYLVFEYLKHDLQGLIDKKVQFDLSHLKCIMTQILKGMIYLHQQKVLHRDIKGANILISSEGQVKLADFGLARIFYPNEKQAKYTNRVVTLWYRAPELLLGSQNYSDTLDVWSLGCVFAELYLQQVLFPGDKEAKQIELIYEKCGSVNEDNWPGVTQLPGYKEYGPKKNYPRKIREWLIKESKGTMPESLADLIDKMLTMDPKIRITASQALNHEFFKQSPQACPPSKLPLLDEDYHEFIVKSEKKQKTNFKKKFAFQKPLYDPSEPSSRDYWTPTIEMFSQRKLILQAAPIQYEEQKSVASLNNLKPFQYQQQEAVNPAQQDFRQRQGSFNTSGQQQYERPQYQGQQDGRPSGYDPNYQRNRYHKPSFDGEQQQQPYGRPQPPYEKRYNNERPPNFYERKDSRFNKYPQPPPINQVQQQSQDTVQTELPILENAPVKEKNPEDVRRSRSRRSSSSSSSSGSKNSRSRSSSQSKGRQRKRTESPTNNRYQGTKSANKYYKPYRNDYYNRNYDHQNYRDDYRPPYFDQKSADYTREEPKPQPLQDKPQSREEPILQPVIPLPTEESKEPPKQQQVVPEKERREDASFPFERSKQWTSGYREQQQERRNYYYDNRQTTYDQGKRTGSKYQFEGSNQPTTEGVSITFKERDNRPYNQNPYYQERRQPYQHQDKYNRPYDDRDKSRDYKNDYSRDREPYPKSDKNELQPEIPQPLPPSQIIAPNEKVVEVQQPVVVVKKDLRDLDLSAVSMLPPKITQPLQAIREPLEQPIKTSEDQGQTGGKEERRFAYQLNKQDSQDRNERQQRYQQLQQQRGDSRERHYQERTRNTGSGYRPPIPQQFSSNYHRDDFHQKQDYIPRQSHDYDGKPPRYDDRRDDSKRYDRRGSQERNDGHYKRDFTDNRPYQNRNESYDKYNQHQSYKSYERDQGTRDYSRVGHHDQQRRPNYNRDEHGQYQERRPYDRGDYQSRDPELGKRPYVKRSRSRSIGDRDKLKPRYSPQRDRLQQDANQGSNSRKDSKEFYEEGEIKRQ